MRKCQIPEPERRNTFPIRRIDACQREHGHYGAHRSKEREWRDHDKKSWKRREQK